MLRQTPAADLHRQALAAALAVSFWEGTRQSKRDRSTLHQQHLCSMPGMLSTSAACRTCLATRCRAATALSEYTALHHARQQDEESRGQLLPCGSWLRLGFESASLFTDCRCRQPLVPCCGSPRRERCPAASSAALAGQGKQSISLSQGSRCGTAPAISHTSLAAQGRQFVCPSNMELAPRIVCASLTGQGGREAVHQLEPWLKVVNKHLL